jgi:S-adenosylmethionine:tRNA ribosyltransferase-isomerase
VKTSLFDFDLPEQLIADRPVSPRDASRMLIVDDSLRDAMVRDLPKLLKAGDVMVFNDTRVIPARLFGKRGDAKIEILLHKQMGGGWNCFAKPAKKLQIGDRLDFAKDFSAIVAGKLPDGQVTLVFSVDSTLLKQKLEEYGHMPLPPYIEKKRAADASDRDSYQTVYAKHNGSVAAPTAGLHFSDNLLKAIDTAGVKRVYITLHVGGGTFLPVKVEDTKHHVMHSERVLVTAETAQLINRAKVQGGRVIAVGTTALRALESATDIDGKVGRFDRETNIFITPGYRFRTVDMLLTNFHLPRSTLFMLTCAFCGIERMKDAYQHAIARQYRFYSYGDACLLYKQSGSGIQDSGK